MHGPVCWLLAEATICKSMHAGTVYALVQQLEKIVEFSLNHQTVYRFSIDLYAACVVWRARSRK
jgi:hypothetical protein